MVHSHSFGHITGLCGICGFDGRAQILFTDNQYIGFMQPGNYLQPEFGPSVTINSKGPFWIVPGQKCDFHLFFTQLSGVRSLMLTSGSTIAEYGFTGIIDISGYITMQGCYVFEPAKTYYIDLAVISTPTEA